LDDFASNLAECPLQLNFGAETFAIGDTVSYRVAGSLEGFPFMETLLEVHDDHVLIGVDATLPLHITRRVAQRQAIMWSSCLI